MGVFSPVAFRLYGTKDIPHAATNDAGVHNSNRVGRSRYSSPVNLRSSNRQYWLELDHPCGPYFIKRFGDSCSSIYSSDSLCFGDLRLHVGDSFRTFGRNRDCGSRRCSNLVLVLPTGSTCFQDSVQRMCTALDHLDRVSPFLCNGFFSTTFSESRPGQHQGSSLAASAVYACLFFA